jgi:heme-degrading monooxygenase HmoA
MRMFAVIFEVQPKQESWNAYLGLAGSLRPELEKINGFIDNERFASRSWQGRVLSLSTWRDEKALIRWRTLSLHHGAQERGRSGIFADYHLRVGEVVADTHVPKGQSLQQQRFDETESGAAKLVTISEFRALGGGWAGSDALAVDLGLPTAESRSIVAHEVFAGINDPAKLLLLVSWGDRAAGEGWRPDPAGGSDMRHRAVRIIRDYGMHDRREAPQYYRAIEPAANRR